MPGDFGVQSFGEIFFSNFIFVNSSSEFKTCISQAISKDRSHDAVRSCSLPSELVDPYGCPIGRHELALRLQKLKLGFLPAFPDTMLGVRSA